MSLLSVISLRRALPSEEELWLFNKVSTCFGSLITDQRTKEIVRDVLQLKTWLEGSVKSTQEIRQQITFLNSRHPLSLRNVKVSTLLAGMLAIDARKKNPEYLQRGLEILLEERLDTGAWLKELLPSFQEKATTDRIIEKLGSIGSSLKIQQLVLKIISRLLVLNKLPHGSLQLTFSDNLCLAIFLERLFEQEKPKRGYYQAAEYGIPRDIQYDAKRQSICIAGNGNFFAAYGAYKNVEKAHAITKELHDSYRFVARAVNSTQSEKPDENEKDNEEMLNDINLHKMFFNLCQEGIWPIEDVQEYVERSWYDGKEIEAPKTSVTLPWAENGSFWDLFKSKQFLSLDEILSAARQLSSALTTIHANEYILSDIKGQNILVGGRNENFRCSFIDFGLAFPLDDAVDSVSFEIGSYGSVYITAPEFLGIPFKFYGDWKAVEMWALGFELYLFVFREYPRWLSITGKYTKEKIITDQEHRQIQKDVMATIENPRKALLEKKGTLSKKEKLQLLVYNLLRYHPRDRLTAEQVYEYVTTQF